MGRFAKQILFKGHRILSPSNGRIEEGRGCNEARFDRVGEMSGEKSGHYANDRAPRMLSLTNGLDIDGLAVTFSDSLMLHTYIPTVT